MGYDFRHHNNVRDPLLKLVYHDAERISLLGPNIWEITPKTIKSENL